MSDKYVLIYIFSSKSAEFIGNLMYLTCEYNMKITDFAHISRKRTPCLDLLKKYRITLKPIEIL